MIWPSLEAVIPGWYKFWRKASQKQAKEKGWYSDLAQSGAPESSISQIMWYSSKMLTVQSARQEGSLVSFLCTGTTTTLCRTKAGIWLWFMQCCYNVRMQFWQAWSFIHAVVDTIDPCERNGDAKTGGFMSGIWGLQNSNVLSVRSAFDLYPSRLVSAMNFVTM